MSDSRPRQWGKWWFSIGLALCMAVLGLRVGMPLYRRQRAFDTMTRMRVAASRAPWIPDWARGFVHEGWHSPLDRIDWVTTSNVTLSHTQIRELLLQLQELDELPAIDVATAPLEDADLEIIASFSNLKNLGLAATSVTGDGLKHIARLSNLRTLDLSRTQIDDAGLIHLTQMTKLENLNIDQTRISNDGLEHLAGLVNLHDLSVSNTGVTDAGLEKLRISLPHLAVTDD